MEQKKPVFDRIIQVLTIIIAIVTAYNSFKLSSLDSEIKESNLYNEVLKDISSDKMILRQDVALLILNKYKEDDESNKDFIRELAFYFCTDTLRNAGLFNYARHFLEMEKDSVRLKFIDSILASSVTRNMKEVISSSELTASKDSNKTTLKPKDENEIKIMNNQRQKINFLSGKWTCFIQVRDNNIVENEKFKRFTESLKEKALLPKVEETKDLKASTKEIRYFNSSDRKFANVIREKAKTEGIDLIIRDYTKSGFEAPAGQLEVWIGSI